MTKWYTSRISDDHQMIERCRRFGGFAGSAYGEPLDATMSGARLGFSPWISNGCHWRIYGEESTENKKTKAPCCSCSFQERYQRNAYIYIYIPAICGFHRTCKEALRSFCIFCFPWHLFSLTEKLGHVVDQKKLATSRASGLVPGIIHRVWPSGNSASSGSCRKILRSHW